MRLARAVAWACALALGACAEAPSSSAADSPAALAGTRWVGVVAGGADARTLPRLEFVGQGRLAGYTGCNMLSGAWKMEGDEVRIGALVTTKRLCLGAPGEVEKRFLAAVGAEGRGRREGDRLVFTGPQGARFEFEPAAAG